MLCYKLGRVRHNLCRIWHGSAMRIVADFMWFVLVVPGGVFVHLSSIARSHVILVNIVWHCWIFF